MSENVLALYDCRSKQEYIYRTNKMKEITGASALLSDLFKGFFCNENKDFIINGNWKTTAPPDYIEYFKNSGYDAEVIYEGGGNLCVIFKDMDTYVRINRVLSRKVLEDTFGVSIIASATKVTGDFPADRRRLYAENALQKNLGAYHIPCSVLPFTQVDRLTYQPIVEKEDNKHQYTTESHKKKKKYESMEHDESEIIETTLDEMIDKGNDSLLAVIYIDGNNMGEKVKKATENISDYSSGINALREFSVNTNSDFVEKPWKAIQARLTELYRNAANSDEQKHYLCRKVIGGGDEITLVCNAHAVPTILETYFETLISENSVASEKNSSCAGVAIFHSHAPFADVYEIAEQCCESGKKLSHLDGNKNNNYIDFHFCHAGITNSLDAVRERQEAEFTARPYEYSTTWKAFTDWGNKLSMIKRSDVKALNEAIVKGDSYYKTELRRIKSRKKLSDVDENDRELEKMIFDISIVYDLWFSKAENGGEADA